jgi:hypothetical protein
VGGYDPGVDNLNVFNTVLESTNRILEDAAPKLDALGTGLSDTETELRGELVALTTELETLDKEVESWEAAAVAAVKEVNDDAHKVVEVRLPALDTDMAAARQRVDGALATHGTTWQPRLDELEARGFDALDTVLTSEEQDFERWAGEAEAALGALHVSLNAEGAEVKRDTDEAVAALDAAKDAAVDAHTAARTALEAQLHDFDDSLPKEVDKRCHDTSATVPVWIESEWGGTITTLVTAYHNVLQALGKDESALIEQESGRVTGIVDTTETSLSEAEAEFERCAVSAEWSEREMKEVSELRPQIEKADEEVTEIRALMEAVGP